MPPSKTSPGVSPFRVTIWTMSGLQCCPLGVGEETADGDFRLTCSSRLTVGGVLSVIFVYNSFNLFLFEQRDCSKFLMLFDSLFAFRRLVVALFASPRGIRL